MTTPRQRSRPRRRRSGRRALARGGRLERDAARRDAVANRAAREPRERARRGPERRRHPRWTRARGCRGSASPIAVYETVRNRHSYSGRSLIRLRKI
eukprot:30920-Pelagococcus_subviridis.AAC.27